MNFNSLFNSDVWKADFFGGSHQIGCTCETCSFFKRNFFPPEPKRDFHLQLEMPGTKKKDVSVKLQGSQVVVTWTTRLGELKTYSCTVGTRYYEQDKLSCSYEDGLLTIRAPLKKEKPQEPLAEPEKQIEIK